MSEIKRKIMFRVEHQGDNISSAANGEITAKNFEEMAEELERWFTRPNTKCFITEVNEL